MADSQVAAHDGAIGAIESSNSELVDIHVAEQICGLSRATIYRKLADPADPFPRPLPLSVRRRKFLRSELLAWREDRMAERRVGAEAGRG